MSIVKAAGGGPLKRLSAPDLGELIRALEAGQETFKRLPQEARKSFVDNYEHLFRGNLGEAKRALEGRGAAHPTNPASGSTVDEDSPADADNELADSEETTTERKQYTWAFDQYSFDVCLQLRLENPGTAEGLVNAGEHGLGCVKCDKVTPLAECANCGHGTHALGLSPRKVVGLFCHQCKHGFTTWKCACGCVNPISHLTVLKLKAKSGTCLIVTAACGDATSAEVKYLTGFRDEVLLKGAMGRLFVRSYYALAPPLAEIVSRSTLLRRLTILLLVRPVIRLLRSFRRATSTPARA